MHATVEPGLASFVTATQDPAKPSISADQIFNNLQVNQLGETFSGGDVSVSDIAAAGQWNEEKRREIGKNLREKHTLECVQHESELRAEEIKVCKFLLIEREQYHSRLLPSSHYSLMNGLFSHLFFKFLTLTECMQTGNTFLYTRNNNFVLYVFS